MPEFTVTKKPLSWFKIHRQAWRTFDEEKLRRLGESLKARQLHPVLAQPDGTLIAGERRLRAAQLVGLKELEVKIADRQLSDSEVKLWQLTENMQREDWSGYQKWMVCTEILTMNTNWGGKELAEHLHLDPSTITRLLSPSKCIGPVQDALKESKIGISDCYAISKAPAAEQPELLHMKLAGASRDALESAGRKSRNGVKPAVRVGSVRCILPSGVKIVVSGAAISLDTLIESLGEAAKQARKARDQGLDAKTFQAVMRDMAKAG